MQPTAVKSKPTSPIVREYHIDGIKYTVSAITKAGAREDAATKVRRMIRKEVSNLAIK